jgi:hypothetical protein
MASHSHISILNETGMSFSIGFIGLGILITFFSAFLAKLIIKSIKNFSFNYPHKIKIKL